MLLCSLIVQFKQSLRVCLWMLLIYASMENESECVWVSSDLYTEKQMAVIVLAHNLKKTALRTAKLSHLHTAGINDCAATCTQTNTH